RAQGRLPLRRGAPGDALRARLRPGAARPGAGLDGGRRARARLPALGEDGAGGGLGDAARRPRRRRGHAGTDRYQRPVRDVAPDPAPRQPVVSAASSSRNSRNALTFGRSQALGGATIQYAALAGKLNSNGATRRPAARSSSTRTLRPSATPWPSI